MGCIETDLFYACVDNERERQDQIWGGPVNDDKNTPRDWILFICTEAGKSDTSDRLQFEKQMVQVAALARAAFESARRKNNG